MQLWYTGPGNLISRECIHKDITNSWISALVINSWMQNPGVMFMILIKNWTFRRDLLLLPSGFESALFIIHGQPGSSNCSHGISYSSWDLGIINTKARSINAQAVCILGHLFGYHQNRNVCSTEINLYREADKNEKDSEMTSWYV